MPDSFGSALVGADAGGNAAFATVESKRTGGVDVSKGPSSMPFA